MVHPLLPRKVVACPAPGNGPKYTDCRERGIVVSSGARWVSLSTSLTREPCCQAVKRDVLCGTCLIFSVENSMGETLTCRPPIDAPQDGFCPSDSGIGRRNSTGCLQVTVT